MFINLQEELLLFDQFQGGGWGCSLTHYHKLSGLKQYPYIICKLGNLGRFAQSICLGSLQD